jgi:hypothetical protein
MAVDEVATTTTAAVMTTTEADTTTLKTTEPQPTLHRRLSLAPTPGPHPLRTASRHHLPAGFLPHKQAAGKVREATAAHRLSRSAPHG